MIKYGILIGGIAFYFFAITTLIDIIRDENFTRSFINLIDVNADGVITSKEIKAFKPCAEYDGKKITKAFKEHGTRVDINDLSQAITPNQVLDSIKKCVLAADVEALSQDSKIKTLSKTEVTKQFLGTFDIDNDGNIRFSEYHISNQFLKKTPKNLRQIFRYFDKNHDWVISTKELEKSKPKSLHTFLVSGKRK